MIKSHRGRTTQLALIFILLVLLSAVLSSQTTDAKIAPESLHRPVINASISVNTTVEGQPIDMGHLLGTNVPAWLGSERLQNPVLQTQAIASGSKLIRVPGGSWSNEYDWLACERGWGIDKSAVCNWPWAATPSDFIRFAQATDQSILYTANINGTAKEAAALVAFFNGDPNDTRVIGKDVRGRDWGTVGQWAKMRVEKGFPDSTNVKFWEIGNEIYGGKPSMSPGCTRWGWEVVWTCSPQEYVNGVGSGTQRHEGLKEFKHWMTFVDPSIDIGAVGIPIQSHWLDWGSLVIKHGAKVMDYYAIHEFPYFIPPDDHKEILTLPHERWSEIGKDIKKTFKDQANMNDMTVAVTEYNLLADQTKDVKNWMTWAVNGLYIADSIGQMGENGVDIANFWAFSTPQHDNGTSFSLTDDATSRRSPTYFVFPLWAKFGNALLPVENSLPADTTFSVYAGRVDANTFTILAINKTDTPISADITLDGADRVQRGQYSYMRAIRLDSKRVIYNGVSEPKNDLSDAPPLQLRNFDSHEFPPYSVTLIELDVRTFRQ